MRKSLLLWGGISLFIFFSCKKIETDIQNNPPGISSSLAFTSTSCQNYPLIDSMPNYNTDADSVEIPTILGNQRTNPYSLGIMRQAYNNLGYSSLP